MRMFWNSAALLLLVSTTSVSFSHAQGLSDDGGKEATIKSSIAKDTIESSVGARHVNFQKELGISLDFLDAIGQRIHSARLVPDPVALALEAQALSVAEQVSGKEASISSSLVLNEAVELAKLRGVSTELTAIALIVTDAQTQKGLKRLAAQAMALEEEAQAKVASGEVDKEIDGTLHVTNHTHEAVKVYLDGRYLGVVYQGHSRSFHVHSHEWHNHLDAYCAQQGSLIEHASYEGHTHHLNWHIGH